ncbi:CHAD domain-containing protein [Botrimarina sp.]|uniref:CHAD domain-containing protein n=1 Tax=Botrimarina sp. TaxID=2795802 RepID=UPI0032EE1895
MSYRIETGEDLSSAVRRIAAEQIDKALAEIDDRSLDTPDTVHQVRKRMKKLRGLLRIARPGLGGSYKRENVALRDAARRLSELRDSKVLLDTYDDLMGHYADQVNRQAFASVRRELTRQRKHLTTDGAPPEERLAEIRAALVACRERAPRWKLDRPDARTIHAGLKKTYSRARKRLEEASHDPTPERLHQLRKRAKYHGRHCQLLQDAWAGPIKARRREAERLSDLLGDDHDLAVLCDTVVAAPDDFGEPADTEALLGLAARRRRALQGEALPLAGRLFFESPSDAADRLAGYWKAAAAAN